MTLFHSMEGGLTVIPYSYEGCVWALQVLVLPYKKCPYKGRIELSVCLLWTKLCSYHSVYSQAYMLPSLVNDYEIYLPIELQDICFWYWFMFKKNPSVDHICGLSSGIHSFSGSKHFQKSTAYMFISRTQDLFPLSFLQLLDVDDS